MVGGQNYHGGNNEPYELGCDLKSGGGRPESLRSADNISPSNHFLMLIAFCILYLTYSPWPSVGAIWPRSTKENPGTDELHGYARAGDACTFMDCRARSRQPTRLPHGYAWQ
jgi:hypothetical protein